MKNSRAFTLIELLVVVLIIGILAAVAVPQYKVAVKKAFIATYLPVVDALYKGQQAYFLANGEYTFELDKLDISMPIGADCIKTAASSGKYYYNCPNGVSWGSGTSTNEMSVTANSWSKKIGLWKALTDYESSALGFTYKAGKTYCQVRKVDGVADSAGVRACQSFGGEYKGTGSNWEVYELP